MFSFGKYMLNSWGKRLLGLGCWAIALALVSCGKIKDKGQELASKAEQKVVQKASEWADKAFPHFDAYQPDTKYNRKRFQEFLQVPLTPDVKDLYCFGDAMGIDADFQFAFRCDSSTARRIIEKHRLALQPENADCAFGIQDDFEWWNKETIQKLPLYGWKGEHEYFKYFWYDAQHGKAYFFDFDM